NVFAVENEVAETIATALQVKLLPQESARFAQVATGDPQAYDLFLKGNYYANRAFAHGDTKTPQATVSRAAALYREAVARDPRFALAWARLSLLESRAWWYGADTADARIGEAERTAKKALALDPDLPQTHMAMGFAAYYGHQDYPAALAQFEQAARGLPNDADVMAAIASIHRRQGGWELALAEFQQAATLDPRNPRRYYETGVTLTELRRYAEADRQFNQALMIEPRDYMVRAYRIRLAFLSGETARARRELAAIPPDADPRGSFAALRFEFAWLARKPDDAIAALASAPAWVSSAFAEYEVPTNLLRARAWSMKGDEAHARRAYEEARATLRNALRQQPDRPVFWGAFGMTEAGLGDKQAAVGAGGRAVQLVPVSGDAFYGSAHLAVLAAIYAQTAAAGPAVQLLGKLLAMPSGGTISVPLLRLDPIWDPIRKSPAFQSLLKIYQHKEGTAATTTSRRQRQDIRSEFTRHSRRYGRAACSDYEANLLMVAARSRSTAARTAQLATWSFTKPAACMVA
ncbi:MAG TPA: tetratricopeptide repeat protein, partial [Gammaproteobacteria bacterium]|nr:tetratricopeptide repeat protein [Gammaproteobacteria bacterium]